MTFFFCVLYFCVFMCFYFCLLCFLDFDGLKSSFYFCLSVVFSSVKISLGYNVIYSYFFVLIFLTGVLSLIIYFSSLNFSYTGFININFFIFFFGFFFIFFDYNILLVDFDLGGVYFHYNFFYFFWIFLVLFFFLFLISIGLSFKGCLRWI